MKYVKQVLCKCFVVCCTLCNKKVVVMSHMARIHIATKIKYIVCEHCLKASTTMHLHKEVNHKNSESIKIFSLLDLSERKCPQRFEAPPAPRIFALAATPSCSMAFIEKKIEIGPSRVHFTVHIREGFN